MACAKNYETVSTFVKVMQEKLWPLFSGHGVYGFPKKFQTCLSTPTATFPNFYYAYVPIDPTNVRT